MKTLYLHIGTSKTATSSIQRFLKQNTEMLLENNYCFPLPSFKYEDASVGRNGHFLVFSDDKIALDPSPEAEKLRNERLKSGLDMIHKSFQDCDNVILSEENLWNASAYHTRNYTQILPQDAQKYGYTIKIVVYLRRQDQFIASVWNQHIKWAQTSKTLPAYIEHVMKKTPLYLAYDRMLQLIADTFGEDNLIVRRFEPDAWVDHSVISDFLNAVGLDPSLPWKPLKKEINPRLTENAAEIQRLVNASTFLTEEEKRSFSKYTRELSKNTSSESYSYFIPKETASFLAQFKKGNQLVAEKYIKDGKPLFSDKIQKLPLWEPHNPEMQRDLCQLMISMQEDETAQKDSVKILLVILFDLYKQVDMLKSFRDKVRHPFHFLREKIFSG